jgi:TPR repeat protein
MLRTSISACGKVGYGFVPGLGKQGKVAKTAIRTLQTHEFDGKTYTRDDESPYYLHWEEWPYWMPVIRLLADSGRPSDMTRLGIWYISRQNTQKQGADWLNRALAAGDIQAMFEVGKWACSNEAMAEFFGITETEGKELIKNASHMGCEQAAKALGYKKTSSFSGTGYPRYRPPLVDVREQRIPKT